MSNTIILVNTTYFFTFKDAIIQSLIFYWDILELEGGKQIGIIPEADS